jgi:hypothetical protein
MRRLDQGTAAQFAALTLGHLTREWPCKLDQILTSPDDLAHPLTLHPIFHGSFDWHSCVHGWWQVMRLARLFPGMTESANVEQLANQMLVPDRVAGEIAYLERPLTGGFERPYGWAWLLALHNELELRPEQPWARTVEPLARAFASRFAGYLPRLVYPVRSGTHGNTAFALILALRWATTHDASLAALISDRARAWFGGDRDCRPWERPQRWPAGASRWTEPHARLVLAQARRRDAGSSGGARGCRRSSRGCLAPSCRRLHGRTLAGHFRSVGNGLLRV